MSLKHAYEIARILQIEGFQAFVLHTDHKRSRGKVATNAPRETTNSVAGLVSL